MAISVRYGPDPALLGQVAQGAGYGQFSTNRQRERLQRIQMVQDIMARNRQQGMQAQGMAADQAARQQQLGLQSRQQQLDQQHRQSQLGLQYDELGLRAQGQRADQATRQQQLGLQARGQDLDQFNRQQSLAADLYRFGAGQQFQAQRDQFGAVQNWMQQNQRFEQQQDLSAQEAQQRQDMFEYQFTRQQKHRLQQLAQANSWIDQEARPGGSLNADQAQQLRWQMQQEAAGIRPQAIPRPAPSPTIGQELQTRVTQAADGGTYILQPNGQIDYRPAPAPRQGTAGQRQPSIRDYMSARQQVVQEAAASGQQLTPQQADQEARRRIEAFQSGGQGSQGQPQQGQQPPGAPPPPPPGSGGQPQGPAGGGGFGMMIPVAGGGVRRWSTLNEGVQAQWRQNWAAMDPAEREQLSQQVRDAGGVLPTDMNAQGGQPQRLSTEQQADVLVQATRNLVNNPQAAEAAEAGQTLALFARNDNNWAALPDQQWQQLHTAMTHMIRSGAGRTIPPEMQQRFRQALAARQGGRQ